MKAFYDKPPNCQLCMDMPMEQGSFACSQCRELLRDEVEVISLGVGFFADKAVVKKSNGKLETVPVKTLTMKD